MFKTLMKWSVRLSLIAGGAAGLARLLQSKSTSSKPTAGVIPTIGGDTWPPVPTNQNRKD